MRGRLVEFRLSASAADELSKRASARGISPGVFAKQLVVSALEGERRNEELLDRVAEIQRQLEHADGSAGFREELHGLRLDLATLLRVLLVQALHIPDEKATAWVREHLSRR